MSPRDEAAACESLAGSRKVQGENFRKTLLD